MARPSFRTQQLLLLALAAVATSWACSSGGGGGCSGGGCASLQTIPDGGWYRGPKTDNPVDVRLSPAGVKFMNDNFLLLVSQFADGGKLSVPIPCTVSNVSGLGNVAIADQGNVAGSARMDGKCSPGEGATLPIVINSFALKPVAPDTVAVTLNVTINTGPIYIDPTSRCDSICCLGLGFLTNDCGGQCCCGACLFGACIGIPTSGVVQCSIDFNNTGPGNTFAANVQFTIDSKWDKLLSFNLSLAGTEVCGASGAKPSPECLDPNSINLSSANGCNIGNGACDIANWGPIKDTLLQILSPVLQSKIQGIVDKQPCEACGGAGTLPCMEIPPGATSSCDPGNQVCVDAVATSCQSDLNCAPGKTCTGGTCQRCVPRFLGVQGRLPLATLLGKYGVPASAEVDLSVALGASVSVDKGLNFGTRAGINSVGIANCVPSATAPLLPALGVPDFDGEAPATLDGGPYHVAIGVSDPFINLAMYEVEQSGALCLEITSKNFAALNTGLFKTFLPSIGTLATRDGLDAPMLIALRPATPPTVTIGAGTFDGGTLEAPLIDLKMKDVTIDFYAMFDDRYALLFSLTADVDFPLALAFQGCDTVTPVIGDVKSLITNVRSSSSEILAEDPSVLVGLLPAVLGIAQPAIAGILKPIALPAVGPFKLRVEAAKGIEQATLPTADAGATYNFMGLYAQLVPGTAQCATAVPTTFASLNRSVIPAASQMRLSADHALPLPVAVLGVRAEGMSGTAEFSYRVDGSLWTFFRRANAAGELEIADPAFLMQGQHLIEVQSRMAQEPHGVSAPVSVGFNVDWDPPEVTLRLDRAHDRVELSARDLFTPQSALLWSYQVGDGPWSEYGPAREVDLAAVDGAGGLGVRVRDAAGNVGAASYRASTLALRPDSPTPADRSAAATGCSAAEGALGLWGVLVSAGWLARRRRRA